MGGVPDGSAGGAVVIAGARSLSPAQRDELRRAYVREGATIAELADRFYVGRTTVWRILEQGGVERRPAIKRADRTTIPQATLDATRVLYQSGYSASEVGQVTGVCQSAVLKRLAIAGVERRSGSEAIRLAHARARGDR